MRKDMALSGATMLPMFSSIIPQSLVTAVRGALSDDRPYRVTFGETYAPMGVKL